MRVFSGEKAASRTSLFDFPQIANRYPYEEVRTSCGRGRREAVVP